MNNNKLEQVVHSKADLDKDLEALKAFMISLKEDLDKEAKTPLETFSKNLRGCLAVEAAKKEEVADKKLKLKEKT